MESKAASHRQDRKSVERSRRASRRKSGPKSNDLFHNRQEGKEGRRRYSESHRRSSRNKTVIQRRERAERPPRLEDLGHPGIGRSSLPAGLPTPRFKSEVPTHGGSEAKVAVEEKGAEGRAEPMQQEETTTEEEGEEDVRWTPEMIAEAALGVLGDDRQLQLGYARWLRLVLSLSDTPPAGEVVAAGLVPRLLDFLRDEEFPEIRPEALCALTNIASTEHTRVVAGEPEALPTLKALLSSSDLYLREQSAWCLGNIAGDCVEMRDMVLAAGVMQPLLRSLSPAEHGSTSFMRTGTWALNNLCRGMPPPPLRTVLPVMPIIRPIISASNTGDEGALVDAGWVIYHITRGGADRIDAVLSARLLTRLPDLILHDSAQVVRPVLRAMDNLACSSGAHRGALIAAGVLDPLLETLSHDSSKVRADALRLLSSIASGSSDQVAAVASTGDMIVSVMTELEEGNALCRREAAWVFLNMCECGFDAHESIVPEMVASGVISAVCSNLNRESDPESLVVMLSLLFILLDVGEGEEDGSKLSEYVVLVEECDGFDRVMDLMNDHDDMEVYHRALDIVKVFVDDGNDDDHEATESGAEQHRFGGATTDRRSDCDSDSMSDDSLSDDSFHPELGGTGGPITPPPKAEPLSRYKGIPTVSPQKGAVSSEGAAVTAGGFENGRTGGGGFRYDFGTPPRQPLGAVADPGVLNRGFGGKKEGGGIWDCDVADSVLGSGKNGRTFRKSELDKTE